MAALGTTDIARSARDAGWSGNDLVTAVAVAMAESGGNPDAVSPPNANGTRDHGLFQINDIWNPASFAWADPRANARFSHDVIWRKQGWQAWSTYNSGAYRKYLNQAASAVASLNGTSSSTGQAPVADNAVGFGLGTLGAIFDASFWKRVGLGGLGGLLMLFAWQMYNGKPLALASGIAKGAAIV